MILRKFECFLVYILTAFSPDPNSLANFARITSDWWLLRFRNFPEASWKSPKLVPSKLWHLLCSLFWDSRHIEIVYLLFFAFLQLNSCLTLQICITKSLKQAPDTQINKKNVVFSQKVICIATLQLSWTLTLIYG